MPNPFGDLFEELKTDEVDIISNKKAGRVYVSDFRNGEGKYISMVFKDPTDAHDIQLQISAQVQVRVTYLTKDDSITGVEITKVRGKNVEKVNLTTLSFEGVLNILRLFSGLDLKSVANRSLVLDAGIVQDEDELRRHLNTVLADERASEILKELAASNGVLATGDIGNLAKKREAVELFHGLLYDSAVFQQKKTEWKKLKDEDVWQHFFEQNKWIFGYGLEYVFNAPISEQRFEQVLDGADFQTRGKRPDGILKTSGLIQFLNIAEIKLATTPLLREATYRESRVWQPSSELVGAVSQCQQYVRTSTQKLEEVLQLKDKSGNRTGQEVFTFRPKCFLVIGDMGQEFFDDEGRVENPDKLACFEHFRKGLLIPEIITFDQLYMRAKSILDHA